MKKCAPLLPPYFLMQISELNISLSPAPAERVELDLKGVRMRPIMENCIEVRDVIKQCWELSSTNAVRKYWLGNPQRVLESGFL